MLLEIMAEHVLRHALSVAENIEGVSELLSLVDLRLHRSRDVRQYIELRIRSTSSRRMIVFPLLSCIYERASFSL